MEAVFARLESSLETIAETSKCANQLTIDFTSRPLLTLLVERCNVCETLNRHGRNIVHEFLPRSQDPRKSQDSGKKKVSVVTLMESLLRKKAVMVPNPRLMAHNCWLQLSKMLYSFQIPTEIFVSPLNEVKIECPGKKSTPKESRITRQPGEYLAARGCIGSLVF